MPKRIPRAYLRTEHEKKSKKRDKHIRHGDAVSAVVRTIEELDLDSAAHERGSRVTKKLRARTEVADDEGVVRGREEHVGRRGRVV